MAKNVSLRENILKNIFIIIVTLSFIPVLSRALGQIQLGQMNDFLLIISMFLVTVCFANFSFTYKDEGKWKGKKNLLPHIATGVFMLLIALLLESIVLATRVIYPSFYGIIAVFSILLYLGIVLYDFWDLSRI